MCEGKATQKSLIIEALATVEIDNEIENPVQSYFKVRLYRVEDIESERVRTKYGWKYG